MNETRGPLALAYGGGGLFGIAYLLGVAEALIDGGVDLRGAPAIGTSAGSWTAAAVDLGITWADAMDALGPIPRIPDPRSGKLREVAERLFGEARAPRIRVVVTEVPRMRRVVLDGADHPVADLVAASSAVPGMLAPHRVDGQLYIDGGVRSLASADRGAPADHLLVIAPLAGPMFGPGGRMVERLLGREMRTWQNANPGGRVSLIRPNRAIAALARRPDQLFDIERARPAYDLAYDQGGQILDRWAIAAAARRSESEGPRRQR